LDWTYVAQDRDKWRKQAGGEGFDWTYVTKDMHTSQNQTPREF
jgi:hypothetical protein